MANIIKSFAGVEPPAFLIVEKVQFSALPQSQIKQMDVPMRSGAFFINKKHGVRTFTVDFTIKSQEKNQVMYDTEDLAAWLNHDEPQPLVFRDKPNITYYAIVDSAVEIAKFGRSGKGSINFICFDPHGYGAERTYAFSPTNDEPIQLVNGGNTTTAPQMKMEFTQAVTDFAITTDNDMLYFGNPFDVSASTPKNLKPKVLDELAQTTTGWTSGIAVDGGIVAGTLSTNGHAFLQTDKNYGTYSTWHGGSLMKSLNKEVQDFTIEHIIGYDCTANNQMGRVELYLLDVNNAHIGKISLVDASPVSRAVKFEARAGTLTGGRYFGNNFAWIPSGFDNFYGVLRITRKGNNWEAYIAKIDQKTGVHHTRMTKKWKDTSNKWTGKKLAGVQVHIGAYGTRAVTNSMYSARTSVWEHVGKAANEVGFVFEAGDLLEIDNSTGEILKNGEPYFEHLYPSSSFITLDKGVNGVSVSQPVITNGEIKFQERWL